VACGATAQHSFSLIALGKPPVTVSKNESDQISPERLATSIQPFVDFSDSQSKNPSFQARIVEKPITHRLSVNALIR
jgi:hypothetical protein